MQLPWHPKGGCHNPNSEHPAHRIRSGVGRCELRRIEYVEHLLPAILRPALRTFGVFNERSIFNRMVKTRVCIVGAFFAQPKGSYVCQQTRKVGRATDSCSSGIGHPQNAGAHCLVARSDQGTLARTERSFRDHPPGTSGQPARTTVNRRLRLGIENGFFGGNDAWVFTHDRTIVRIRIDHSAFL
jgi:hypothetical protein